MGAEPALTYDFGNDLIVKGQLFYSTIDTAGTRYTPSAYYNTTYGVNDEFTVGRMNKANPYLALYPALQTATPTLVFTGIIASV